MATLILALTRPHHSRRVALVSRRGSHTVDRGAPQPVAAARGHTRAVLRRLRIPSPVAEDAELVVSELVTNALEHTTGPVVLRLRLVRGGRALDVRVRDADPRRPAATEPPANALDEWETGRGLPIVTAVTQECGCDLYPRHKVMWARLALGQQENDHDATSPGLALPPSVGDEIPAARVA